MAATVFDKVMDLRPGASAPAVPVNRILAECRDLGGRRLREALREILEKMEGDLRQRAETAGTPEQRGFLTGLAQALADKGRRLEGLMAEHWVREFDAALRDERTGASPELSLEAMRIVDDGELEEELALKAIAQQLRNKNGDELYGLGRRLYQVAGRENAADEENPAGPEVMVKALQGALREADLDAQYRLHLCRSLLEPIAMAMPNIYGDLNAQLVRHNILPNLPRGYGRSASKASGKEERKNDGKGKNAGNEMLALLQRLAGGESGTPAGGTGGLAGGAGGMAGAGAPVQAQVWASLDSWQQKGAGPATAAAMDAGPTNILREFRTSPACQDLGSLDAITVDIVVTLFDMIFDDPEIADPIKALVGRLQIPVLKVAMLDKAFFASKAHPARRLLDTISQAALRWGRKVGHDDPVYRKIAGIIDRVLADFKQDTSLFLTLCEDLEGFLNQHEAEAEAAPQATRAVALVVKREQEELAGMAVDAELKPWLEKPLPAVVAGLLNWEWRSLLQRLLLEQGPDSQAWAAGLKTVEELVESVRPRRSSRGRLKLAQQLPLLINQLTQGFDYLGMEADRRHSIFDALFSVHSPLLRGTGEEEVVVVSTASLDLILDDEPQLATNAVADGEVTVNNISLAAPLPTAAPQEEMEELHKGDWVEFQEPDGTATRYRLAWISPERGIYLFTNPHSPRALSVSPEAMGLKLQRKEARIVPTEPIFDRAMTRAVEVLQAA